MIWLHKGKKKSMDTRIMKVIAILSPTWALADFAKKKWERTKIIKTLNSVYLWVAIVSVVAVLLFQEYWIQSQE